MIGKLTKSNEANLKLAKEIYHKTILIFLIQLLFYQIHSMAQTTYYSQGSLDPGLITSWKNSRTGSGTSPSNFTTNNQIFVIQNNHVMTTTSRWNINGGSGVKLQIENGATLISDSPVVFSTTPTFQIDNGGTYIHNNNLAFGSSIFNGINSFAQNSNVVLKNFNSTGPSGVVFGNLVINNTTNSGNIQFSGAITLIKGNFIIQSLFPGNEVRLSSSTTLNLTIEGNFEIQSGTLDIASAAGTSDLRSLNIGGNFIQTGGTFKCTGSSYPATIKFTGSGEHFSQTGGTLNSSNMNWLIDSGASLTINSDFMVASSRTFTMNPTSSLTLSPGVKFTINNTAANSCNFNGQNVILKSNSNGTACLGSFNSLGSNLSGATNITVERYIPARRAYRFLASPVTTSNGIDDNWQQNTHITGAGTGFDISSSNNPSMFTLNPSTQSWVAITNTQNENLTQGVGYRLMVRGDRSIDLSNNNATPTSATLSATGIHIAGDKTFNSGSSPALATSTDQYTFTGNPFPSTIDWHTVTKTNISSTYYTWKAQGGNNSKGVYVNYNSNGNTSSDGNVNRYIGSGSSFMVKTENGSPSLLIKESDKTSQAQSDLILGKTTRPNGIRIILNEEDGLFADGAFIYQNSNSEDIYDDYDSEKWINPGVSLYSLTADAKKVSIQGFKTLMNDRIVQLGLEKTETKSYKLIFSEFDNFVADIYLVDNFTHKEINIKNNPVYIFDVNTNEKSKAIDRFLILFNNVTIGQSKLDQIQQFTLYPNPSIETLNINLISTCNDKYEYKIINKLGQKCQQGVLDFESSKNNRINIVDLAHGIYFIQLSNSNSSQIIKFVK